MQAGIYRGVLHHRRATPVEHAFSYPVFMMLVDVRKLDEVCSRTKLWSSTRRFWPAAFVREDFHGDPERPLADAVLDTVFAQEGRRPTGAVFMLANWRYFGVNFNPLTVYYCFDEGYEQPSFILAEVNNTPWNERHTYVLRCDAHNPAQQHEFAKALHVSPFNPLDMTYHWQSNTPGERLHISLAASRQGQKVFAAELALAFEPLSARALRRVLITYPWMTVKVVGAIYWQALKLWWKRVPVHDHEPAVSKAPAKTCNQNTNVRGQNKPSQKIVESNR